MPVEFGVEVFPVGQERFHALDKVLMRHAFDMHNALGRFFDERIYQEELAVKEFTGSISINNRSL